MQVLENFKHADTFAQMPLNDRLVATLYTILLGMGITFVALILIWGLTALMSKIVTSLINSQKPAPATAAKSTPNVATGNTVAAEDDTELVAVITAAVAASLGTSSSQFVVTNITRTVDQTPVWGQVGRTDVMQSRI